MIIINMKFKFKFCEWEMSCPLWSQMEFVEELQFIYIKLLLYLVQKSIWGINIIIEFLNRAKYMFLVNGIFV